MKTKKVKWLKPGIGIGFGYFAGQIATLESKQADELASDGYVTLMPDDICLPDDLPGRKALLEGGYSDIEELRGLKQEDLIEIKGIGKGLADQILKYMEKL